MILILEIVYEMRFCPSFESCTGDGLDIQLSIISHLMSVLLGTFFTQ